MVTTHENAYVSPLHFCFENKKPPDPTTELPKDAVVVKAEREESCDERCEKQEGNMRCTTDAIKAINNCDRMKQHFGCEAGCDSNFGEDQPAYVWPEAPQPALPAKCLINDPDKQMISCSGKHRLTSRLCACVPVE